MTCCIPQTTFIDHKNISACHIYQQTLLLEKNLKKNAFYRYFLHSTLKTEINLNLER